MKTLFTLVLSFFFLFTSAQDCGYMDMLDVNDHWTYTAYDAKSKPSGSVSYAVMKKWTSGDSTLVRLAMETQGKKKEENMQLEYDMACANGAIYVDMDRMFSPILESMEGMEFTVESDQMVMPVNPQVGDVLPDAHVTVQIMMNGKVFMTMNVSIIERKIVGTETITTEAGTFECYVLEQTAEVNNRMMNVRTTSKEWLNMEYGMIRSESYKKNGKLESYSELTEASM